MTKVTNKSNELALQQEEQNFLKKWYKLKPQTKQLFNKIVLDNQKIIEKDGKDVFNEDFGKLFAITYDESEEEIKKQIDIEKARFFIIKPRVFPKGKYIQSEDRSEYYCSEADEFDLIEVYDGKTKELVAHDEWKIVKQKYNLSYRQVIYVYYEELIYRWIITSAHFDSFFDIKNKLYKSRDYREPYYIKIKSINEVKEINGVKPSVPFNKIEFEIAERCPAKIAVEACEFIDQSLADYYKNKKENEIEEHEDDEDGLSEIPEIKHKSTIKPSDLPF